MLSFLRTVLSNCGKRKRKEIEMTRLSKQRKIVMIINPMNKEHVYEDYRIYRK